jgi:hypothetical protein
MIMSDKPPASQFAKLADYPGNLARLRLAGCAAGFLRLSAWHIRHSLDLMIAPWTRPGALQWLDLPAPERLVV